MSSETGEIASLRHEEMTTKHEADGISHTIPGINRIKTEPSGVDSDKETVKTMGEEQSLTSAGNVEQVFIKKEDPEETVSNSIKSEIDWDKCIAEDQSILDMEAENYKLDMEMRSQIKEELKIKEEWDEDPDEVCEVSASRIKKEYSEADSLGKGAVGGVIKEEDMEEEEYKLITEDCDIKSESDTSMDATSEVPSNSVEKRKLPRNRHQVASKKACERLSGKTYECTECSYKSTVKNNYHRHLVVHSKNYKLRTCPHCNATFKSIRGRDDHIVRTHPNFITTVTSKLYECKKCDYRTVSKGHFDRHTSIHHEDIEQRLPCGSCKASFRNKVSLDDHVVKKHPEFVESIDRQIYQCANCDYKTTLRNNFGRHLATHSRTHWNRKHVTCLHCNATFIKRGALEDHVVKKHPSFSSTVNKKIYQCAECAYKTIAKNNFERHLLVHLQPASNYEFGKCVHCNATFKKKETLDNHVLKKHTDFVPTVEKKVYECTECSFKTTLRNTFYKHMSHPEVCYEIKKCIHCKATFKTNASLNDHVLKKHPDFFASSSKKIFECSKCDFKTTIRNNFDRHASSLVHRQTKK